MSNYGLQVYNSSGAIQLNSTSIACRVIGSGVAQVQNKTLGTYPYTIVYPMVPIPGNIFGPQTRLWARNETSGKYLGLSTYSYYDVAANISWIDAVDNPVGANISYVITDLGGTDSSSGYGLVVKNSSGQVEFNSADQQMIVTTTWATDLTESSSWPYVQTINYVTTYYNTYDIPISLGGYSSSPYILVDGVSVGGFVTKAGSPTQAFAVGASASIINSSTVRVKVTKMLVGFQGINVNFVPTYHRVNLLIGVLR